MPRRITGAAFLSIDGVIQAGGGPHEDPTRGFPHGGWMGPFAGDEVVEKTLARLFHPPYALLLGRRTYDIFAGYWPHVTGEEAGFGEALTAAENMFSRIRMNRSNGRTATRFPMSPRSKPWCRQMGRTC